MDNELKELLEMRSYRPTDLPFVKRSFLRGVYFGNDWFTQIPRDIFMKNYAPVVEAILFKPSTTIHLVVLKEDPDTILGFSVLSLDLSRLHFVYVKKDWRGKGIGRALVPSTITTVTHLTATGKSLLPKISAIFNPFALE